MEADGAGKVGDNAGALASNVDCVTMCWKGVASGGGEPISLASGVMDSETSESP